MMKPMLNSIKYINKRNFSFGFRRRVKERNHYEVLGVPFNADLDTIKKAYYKQAKKYHPDVNKSPDAIEIFKEVKKAYEIVGDPNNRISYDIEHNFENDSKKYEKKRGHRFMRGPASLKTYYYDQWSGYKPPKWSNLFTGMDSKSEYLFRKNDFDLDRSYRFNRVLKFLYKYRILLYVGLIFSVDLIMLFDNYGIIKIYYMFRDTFFRQEI